MTWLDRMLERFSLTRHLVADDANRAQKHTATLRKADRVIEDYRRLDGVLRITVRKR